MKTYKTAEKDRLRAKARRERNRAMGLCLCGNARVDERNGLCAGCRQRNMLKYQPKRPRLSDVDRFWQYVQKGDGCWLWTSNRHWKGYGQFSYKGKPIYAHRLSWIITSGNIPDGLLVCHRCDNPSCVRPDHLFLGTPEDNTRDMYVKGRARPGGKAVTSHDGI